MPQGLIESAAALHITGITPALSASAASAVFDAVDRARRANVLVSLDVNHRSRLWSPEEAVPVYRRLIAAADIVFAGDDEAGLVVGPGSSAALARGIRSMGPTPVVIKRGAKGAYATVGGAEHEVAPVKVDVVDTVGAGDAFVGAYLAELVAGASVEDRLRTAAVAGAYACTVSGDWEGMPTRAELASLGNQDSVDR